MKTISNSNVNTICPFRIEPIMAKTQRIPVNMAKPLVKSPKRPMLHFPTRLVFLSLKEKNYEFKILIKLKYGGLGGI
jgi:hypothetical protein